MAVGDVKGVFEVVNQLVQDGQDLRNVTGEALTHFRNLLLVKTLADTHPSPEYAATRAFYRSLGFLPLAVLPDLWGPANPCLLMVRPLPLDGTGTSA